MTPASASTLRDKATDDHLAEVESLMHRLALGTSPDVLGPLVCEHLETGGKRLRARLALAATAALGRPRSLAIAWAAACELGHNATLVHDDLQDGDTMRRGKPTTWARHGMEQAINTGDLMLMLPLVALQETSASAEVRAYLSCLWAERMAAVVRGQADEHDMTKAGIVERERYTGAIAGKTGALFQLPVEGAALIAGTSRPRAEQLALPFRTLGIVFQLQDDVLDLYGDKGRESRGSDLREGKISCLVVEHLMHHPGDRDWLFGLLRMPRDSTPDGLVNEAIDRFRDGGALSSVLERIRSEAEDARNASVLESEPALHKLMIELLELILKPIESVH